MNLAACLDPHPDDAVALISRGRRTTYGELRAQAAGLRGGLVGAGIGPGDRVGLVCGNNWYFVVSYLAVIGAGAVAVPLNPTSPGPELTRQLAAVGARGIVVGPTGKRSFAGVDRTGVPTLELVVVSEGDAVANAPDAVVLDDLLVVEPVPIVERSDDDLAVLMFTSGTAGSPKAAMLTHGNLLANLRQIQSQPFRAQRPDDVTFGVLPFFHIFGLNVILNLALHVGCSVLTVERFDPQSSLEAIAKHGVTVISGAPTMWSAWAQLPDAPADAFATVRSASSGAAKLSTEVRDLIETRFGLTVAEGYGLTEASPVVASAAGIPAPAGSIGAPLPGVLVRLMDSAGHDVLVGDAGELQVSGPSVFPGYWEDPEATRAAFTDDGWLRTGDLATVDDDGFIYLVDRMKDLIIVSGFNVYPGEVEAALVEHPAVAAAAVVGVAHPHTGETVRAYIVVEPRKSVEEDEIIEFCEDRLARYKCPTKVLFVDDLPQGLGGKVLRRTLR